jgi:hypothetical protein
VAHTGDVDATWTKLDLPLGVMLYDAAWADSTTPVVGGDGGTLLRNTQSGAP